MKKFTLLLSAIALFAGVCTAQAQGTAKQVVIGDPNFTYSFGPITTYNTFSRTEIIYPKSLINLPAGTRVDTIRFSGYHDAFDFEVVFSAWIANVAENTPLQGLSAEGLTQIADSQVINLNQTIPVTAHAPIIEIAVPGGFTYTGGDIRMLLDSEAEDFARTYFELDENITTQAQQAADDEPVTDETEISRIKMPVAYFVLSTTPTATQTVENTPLHISGTNGAIIINNEYSAEVTVHIYNATGILLRTVKPAPGTTRISDLTPGIYLINGTKVLVR